MLTEATGVRGIFLGFPRVNDTKRPVKFKRSNTTYTRNSLLVGACSGK